MNQETKTRFEQIIAGSTITPDDIVLFEMTFQESLIDSNHWSENTFTLLGFMFGHQLFRDAAIEAQKAIEKVEPQMRRHQHVTHLAELDEKETNLFYSELMNHCYPYRDRFVANLNELLNPDEE